jgi:hypothetical protein
VPISIIVAHCVIEGIAPYTQSRKYDEPKNEGESPEDYDRRCWRFHQHVKNGTVHIPSRAIHSALIAAGKYSKRQIPGQGKATWTQKFAAGIALLEDIDLGFDPEQTAYIDIYAHADGNPKSGRRVMRRFPTNPKWRGEFDVHILDPIITEEVFTEMLETAGMFVGVGQYRPENGGNNGRFEVVSVNWQEDRKPTVARRTATARAA